MENPIWREALADYVEIGEDGSVKLNTDSALQLAYIHSPSHQTQLETLYLSALDVTAERFRLDTQFFGGHEDTYQHRGRFLGERNTLTDATDAQLRRRFATAGEILVGFANSFVFEFTGSNANMASSLANFTLVQPLLRGAGRDVALEQLTAGERALLANLRAYSQYRQGFYTQVAIGELGVSGLRRGGASTNVSVPLGGGGVSGYIGLLQQLQQIRNTQDSLDLQLRTRARLEAFHDDGLIDLVQVDEFRQNVERDKATLLRIADSFELAVDSYKKNTLGLPPDLSVELDDSLIHRFQLVTREPTALQESILELQDHVGDIADVQDRVGWLDDRLDLVGKLPDQTDVEQIRQLLTDIADLVEEVRRQLDNVQADLVHMEEAPPTSEQAVDDEDGELIQLASIELREGLGGLKQLFEQAEIDLTTLANGLSEETREATVAENVDWIADLLRLAKGCTLIQKSVHLQVEPVRLLLDGVQADLARLEEAAPDRERMMTDKERETFRREEEKLYDELSIQQQLAKAQADLEGLRNGLSEQTKSDKVDDMVVWLSQFLRLARVSMLIQARARLEADRVN